jgi:uncharacterized membrane protein
MNTTISGGASAPRTESREPGAGLVLGAALVAMGLMTGMFFAFDVSVMPGLADVDDRTFVASMQRINKATLNPVFYLVFMGASLVTPVAAVIEWRAERRGAAAWVIAALIFYGIAFMVTMAINVPLNEELVGAGDPATMADLAAVREDFENPWVAWNIVRTGTSTIALACLGRALVLHGRSRRRC